MNLQDCKHAAKTLGMALFSYIAYASVGLLSWHITFNLMDYPWWVIAYSFFIYCYSLEQWRIVSPNEEPKLMAVVTVINCILLYVYWQ